MYVHPMKMDSINISLPRPMADFVRDVVERDQIISRHVYGT